MDPFHFYPIGSMFIRPESDSAGYIDLLGILPQTVKNMIISPNTPKYITGLGKSYKIPEELQPSIAFAILRVSIGKLPISELSTTLSKELNIEMDIALKMASEIDQDLFAPIQGELDAFWAGLKEGKTTTTDAPHPLPLPEQERGTTSAPLLTKERPGEVSRVERPSTPTPSNSPSYEGEKSATASRTQNVLNLKELNTRPEQKDLPARPVQRKLMPGNRTVDLKNSPSPTAPHPLPLPEQERGTTAPTTPAVPARRIFPLPPNPRP